MKMEMHPLLVERFHLPDALAWNDFVTSGKNATFLFLRDYMDYHQDRFLDHSLMVYRDSGLMALLPCNETTDGALISHQGLTYGGFVHRRESKLVDVLSSFHAVLEYLDRQGIERLYYKAIPRFYNSLPCDEVDYALFLLDARLYRRDCALVINLDDRLPYQKGRKSEVSKARRSGVTTRRDSDFTMFWHHILAPQLESRYDVAPVHSLEEMTLLAERFPDNIKLFGAYLEGQIVAGSVIYETPTVAHAQYLAVSEEGRRVGALDYLFAWLIKDIYCGKKHFDFGICNEAEGRRLNHGILNWKQGFGARSYAHDFYEVLPRKRDQLEGVLDGRSPSGG